MAGILKVDKYQDFNGNDIMTSDGSGNITMPNGIISGQNYPAFAATKTANQDVTSGVNTKVTFDSEIFDTDNAFSDSKFTVPSGKAGKYQINSILNVDAVSDANLQLGKIFIYKNGSSEMESFYDFRNNNIRKITMTLNLVLDLNVSDYLEFYTNITAISGTPRINRDNNRVHVSAYRIGA